MQKCYLVCYLVLTSSLQLGNFMELKDYASKIDNIATELASISSYWGTVPYTARVQIAIAYLRIEQEELAARKRYEIAQMIEKRNAVPDNPKFVETDILGNEKKPHGRPKGSSYKSKD